MLKIEKIRRITGGERGSYFLLELRDGAETVKCKSTGKSCPMFQRSHVPFSDEELMDLLLDLTIPGCLMKVPAEPYVYFEPDTRQKLLLEISYAYKRKAGAPEKGRTPVWEPGGSPT